MKWNFAVTRIVHHEGILSEEEFTAKCACGYKIKLQDYPYQVFELLKSHFIKAGTFQIYADKIINRSWAYK